MAEALSFVGTLTILSAGVDSNVLSHSLLGSAKEIIIRAPAALTAAVTVYGSPLKNALTAGLLPIRKNNDAADVTLVAGKETHITDINVKSIAVHSAGAEAADRVFQVYAVFML